MRCLHATILARNLDYSSMKKWVPDYDNYSNTNLWSGGNSTTITACGFVACYANAYKLNSNTNIRVLVNNKVVAREATEARGPNNAVVANVSALIPVNTDDVVVFSAESGSSVNYKECHFIPGKWV